MTVTELRIENYRSIRSLRLPLKRANIVVGPNGCGKSNLYQSIALIRAAAEGRLAISLAAEGGFSSCFWAGGRSEGPVRVKLGADIGQYRYDLEIGLPNNLPWSAFKMDPEFKAETLSIVEGRKQTLILDRGTNSCRVRNAEGTWVDYVMKLYGAESALSQIVDSRAFPHLDDLRRTILKWRFYHGFRTDVDSPIRRPQPGVRTFIMSADGSDLAAALRTVIENGDDAGLASAVSEAFPDSCLETVTGTGEFQVSVATEGLTRALRAPELSDGTLRYLCLLGALMTPTPAPLLALNEPETSLNESLMIPLANLIARAAATSQIWVTTHSETLAAAISEQLSVAPIKLDKIDGETVRAGRAKGLAYSAEFDG